MYKLYDKNGDEVTFMFSIDANEALGLGHCFVKKPAKQPVEDKTLTKDKKIVTKKVSTKK